MSKQRTKYIDKLLQLMRDNPYLPVRCKVDSDIVCDCDSYGWWLGKLSEKYEPEILEYSTDIEDEITFKEDDDYNYWFEMLFDVDDYPEVSDKDWDEFAKIKVDEVANWQKAIFVSVVV